MIIYGQVLIVFNRAFTVVNIAFVSTYFYHLADSNVLHVLRVLALTEASYLPQCP